MSGYNAFAFVCGGNIDVLLVWHDEDTTCTVGASRRLSGLDLVKHIPAFYCADPAPTIGLYTKPEESTPQPSIAVL